MTPRGRRAGATGAGRVRRRAAPDRRLGGSGCPNRTGRPPTAGGRRRVSSRTMRPRWASSEVRAPVVQCRPPREDVLAAKMSAGSRGSADPSSPVPRPPAARAPRPPSHAAVVSTSIPRWRVPKTETVTPSATCRDTRRPGPGSTRGSDSRSSSASAQRAQDSRAAWRHRVV